MPMGGTLLAASALAGLGSSFLGAKSQTNVPMQTKEQKQLWKKVLMPEIMGRYNLQGQLPSNVENMYLKDILGGAEQGYQANMNQIGGMKLDPATRQSLSFMLGRDRSKAVAQGGRELINLKNKRFEDSLKMAQGLATDDVGFMKQTNPMMAGLSGLLGGVQKGFGTAAGNYAYEQPAGSWMSYLR